MEISNQRGRLKRFIDELFMSWDTSRFTFRHYLLLAAPFLLVSVLIWAVMFRYQTIRTDTVRAYQVDRWTGRTWFISGSRMERVQEAQPQPKKREISYEEMMMLEP